MKIRELKSSDARRASYLIRKTIRECLPGYYSEEVIEALSRTNTPKSLLKRAESRQYFVAEENNVLAGIMGLQGNEVKTSFVNPRFQGRGVGSKLLEKVESLAKQRGIKELRVLSSIGAEDFYKRMGFKRIKKTKSRVQNLEFTDILMRKVL